MEGRTTNHQAASNLQELNIAITWILKDGGMTTHFRIDHSETSYDERSFMILAEEGINDRKSDSDAKNNI